MHCPKGLEAEKSEIKVLTGFLLHVVKKSLGSGLLPSLWFAVNLWHALAERDTTLRSPNCAPQCPEGREQQTVGYKLSELMCFATVAEID